MSLNYQTSSVAYVFVDPKDTEAKENKHIIKDLVENPDEAQLIAIGDALKAVIPYQELTAIRVTVDQVVVAEITPTAEQGSEEPVTPATAPEDQTN